MPSTTLDDLRDCAATDCKRIAKYEVDGKWYRYTHSKKTRGE